MSLERANPAKSQGSPAFSWSAAFVCLVPLSILAPRLVLNRSRSLRTLAWSAVLGGLTATSLVALRVINLNHTDSQPTTASRSTKRSHSASSDASPSTTTTSTTPPPQSSAEPPEDKPAGEPQGKTGEEPTTPATSTSPSTESERTEPSAIFSEPLTLHSAIDNGNMETVKELLSEETVNRVDADGRTPLHCAAARGDDAHGLTALLLEAGAEVTASDQHGWTALHLAAQSGNEAALRALLEKDPNTCRETPHKLTAYDVGTESAKRIIEQLRNRQTAQIADAIESEDLAALERLVKQGADLDRRSVSHERPLDVAIRLRKRKALEKLLDLGAKADVSWLQSAIRANIPRRLLKQVVKKRTELTKPACQGRLLTTAMKQNRPDLINLFASLKTITSSHIISACKAERRQQLLGLLNLIGGVNAQIPYPLSEGGEVRVSSLHIVAHHGDPQLIETLLRRGADLTAVADPRDYGTPLHWAVGCDEEKRRRDNTGALLAAAKEAGKSEELLAKAKASQGCPLLQAIDLKDTIVIRWLLSAGADEESRGKALSALVSSGDERTASILLSYKAKAENADLLIRAINHGFSEQTIQALANSKQGLKDEPSPLAGNKTAIEYAWKKGRRDLLPLLATKENVSGSLLIQAVKAKDQFLVIRLKELGADLDAGQGRALFSAIEAEDAQMVTLLIKLGANINIQKEGQIRPLHVAAKRGVKEIVQILRRSGADLYATTAQGETAASLASRSDHHLVARDLKRSLSLSPE